MEMKWVGNRKAISVAFGAALLILVLIGATSYRSTRGLIRATVSREHSYLVFQKLNAMLSQVEDAETGQRGYLITGDERYLQPYFAALGALDQTTKELRELTSRDPEQKRDLSRIEPLVAAKLAELKQTIDLRRDKGVDAARQVVLTDEGKRAMDDIRSIVAGMDSREQASINLHQRESKAAAQKTILVIFLGGALDVLLLFFVFFLLKREIYQRVRAGNELALSEENLRKQTLILQSILSSMGDGVVVADEKGKFLNWNPAAEQILGLGALDVKPEKWTETYGIYLPDMVTPYLPHELPLARACRGEFTLKEEMFVRNGLRPEGVWISIIGSPLKDAEGIMRGGVVVLSEITERKCAEEGIRRLNADLERRTADLEIANKELEAFTYSVAHDLRAPLRHIDGFSKMLMEEDSAALSDEAKRYLTRIREGTSHMGQLVDDLLNLARLGRKELSLQVTGLSSVVEDVLKDLKAENPDREIQWNIHPLPFVECDPGLVRQVFSNLLSNAVKYTRPRKMASIEVSQMIENGEIIILVRDNGVGFSMKYADKLFGVFQRLHRQEDFEGTGVGLATVQRIVRKHGGRVWAEAELDKGATFYFTLGKQNAEGGKETEIGSVQTVESGRKAA